MSVKWVRSKDEPGWTWPIDVETDDDATTEWRLLYNDGLLSREVMLSAASVMQSYAALIDPRITQGDAIAKLKRARAAAKSLIPLSNPEGE